MLGTDPNNTYLGEAKDFTLALLIFMVCSCFHLEDLSAYVYVYALNLSKRKFGGFKEEVPKVERCIGKQGNESKY